MKKILYIDMDGVVADFDTYMNKLLPEKIELGEGDPSTYAARSAMVDDCALKYPRLFEEFDPIEGAFDAVLELDRSGLYDIYFLSTPMLKIPESYMGKRIWIRRVFGEWADKRLILTHRKDLCIGDYLIDDRFTNGAKEFKGMHIHFGSEKFPDWKSVLNLLLHE